MLKPKPKNSYQEFLENKRKFAKKVKQGKKFKDTDGDGLCDYEEKNIYGTDPKNPDTDGDGMPDGNEVKRGRNPLGPGRLKDLFIPHAGNNYLPHALKPTRLLFHAVSIIAIKFVVVVFVLFYPLSAWLSPDMALADAKKIIELTNNLRQAVSLPNLLESPKLAQAAWQKVEDMALNQYFAHVSPTGVSLRNWLEKIGYKYSIAGENLAVGFSRPEDVVLAWKNSPTHYDNIIEKKYTEIGVAMAEGKFEQIDTVYMAQYFAAPATLSLQSGQGTPAQAQVAQPATVKKQEVAVVAKPAEPIEPAAVESQATETSVEGNKVSLAETPAPTITEPLATTTPAIPAEVTQTEKEITIDQQTAVLSIKSDPLNNEKAIQIEVTLPEDTVLAEVIIDNKKIILDKAADQTDSWRGVSLISQAEEKNILDPLIPASITVTDSAGIVSYGKIDWDEIKMIKTTPLEQYQLYKNYPAAGMGTIMDLSGLYFKLILGLALIALLLNIFIEIRKQHPHIIFYSFAFLGLLVAVIIF
ncbi:MAG: CAP domain-containing protein [Candidatus Falkowbacteria bacterium]